jgi:aspartate aminotransferase-like enzyme
VPLQCDEPADFRTFRMGLFGLDKWHDVPRTLQMLRGALETLAPKAKLAA